MLRLSKKADYALIAMKHLALRPDQAAASAREIAEQYDIPVELMAKVLQRLAREGLLASHQGTRGGYQLSRSPSNISVADVIQAVDGPLTVTACSTEEENCDQVLEVQRARSPVEDQRADSRRPADLLDHRACDRSDRAGANLDFPSCRPSGHPPLILHRRRVRWLSSERRQGSTNTGGASAALRCCRCGAPRCLPRARR